MNERTNVEVLSMTSVIFDHAHCGSAVLYLSSYILLVMLNE